MLTWIGGNSAGRSETATASATLTPMGGNTFSPSETCTTSVTATETGGSTFTWSLTTIPSLTVTIATFGVTVIVGSVEVTGVPPIVAPMVVGVPASAAVKVAV